MMAGDSPVEHILREMESGESARVNEALTLAGYVFEKATYPRHTWEKDEGERLAWPKAIARSNVDVDDVQRLKEALIAFIVAQPDGSGTVGALWALGKLSPEPCLGDLFLAMLRHHLNGRPEPLYQSLIGLRNMGEEVFELPGGSSVLDVGQNRALARKFLDRQTPSSGQGAN
jgi:hypothetical protein